MKLKPNTKVNAVIFLKKETGNVIMESDMNMKFDDYNSKLSGLTQSMYNLHYTLKKSIKSGEYTFNWYVCDNNDYLAQFVEIS
jgi:hypothetical protein